MFVVWFDQCKQMFEVEFGVLELEGNGKGRGEMWVRGGGKRGLGQGKF